MLSLWINTLYLVNELSTFDICKWDLTLVQTRWNWDMLDSLCKNVHHTPTWGSMQKEKEKEVQFMVIGKPLLI